MASIRPRIVLAIGLLTGVAGACFGEGGGDSAPASTPDARPSTVAPWVAEANGPSLFEHVGDLARARAGAPYRPPRSELVEAVADLTYGEYRDIRFRPDRTLWPEAPFQLQLFHPGGGSDVPVRIHLVEDGRSRLLSFDADLFSYGSEAEGPTESLDPEAGYAGFRILHPMNDPDVMDEVVVFQGASYFRLLGPDQVYGLSARGLAVDIAEPTGEEFPDFVDFWLVRPEPGDATLTVFALLDGPSVAGAYRFVLDPGEPGGPGTVMDVDARLFLRDDVRKLGVAPLTSMYLHGPMIQSRNDDFRPRVHDSEGLLMLTSKDEWIWRPLTNGEGVRVTSLRDVGPQGFGLVQRTRDFEEYLDLEARYHQRPSHWVIPEGGWGGGGVELLEIPTPSEFNDNVVAYWSPDETGTAGDSLDYAYRIVTFDGRLDGAVHPGGAVPTENRARVVRERIAWDALPGEADPPPRSRRRVVVDFGGGGLGTIAAGRDVEPILTTSSGTVSDLRVQELPDGGRRVTFALEPEGDSDMRLFLQLGDSVVSETWSYLWEPDLVR